jgi:DNA primase
MFPTADVAGRVIAFGGRLVGRAAENAPKYLNSPESAIYRKGESLYGLNWSKGAIRREGSALVVEGYMDYVSLAARGVEHVVAGLGTAMTVEQANLLARYAGRAYLLYDSDAAGLRATFRTADALLRANVHPLVVTLPEGEDPDSVVRQGGAAALRPHLDGAVDVLERKLQILEEHEYFGGIEGARRALDRLLPTLRAVVDPALRDIYIARIAQRTGIRPETLEREARSSGPSRATPSPQRKARPVAVPAGVDASERLLLVLMLRDPELVMLAAERVAPHHVRDPLHREIFVSLTGGGAEPGGRLSEEAAKRLETLRKDPEEITDARQSFEHAVADLDIVGHFFAELDDVDAQLAVASDEEAELLMRRKQELLAALGLLDRGFKASRRYRRYPGRVRREEHGPSRDDG